jgi:hypothetical protein
MSGGNGSHSIEPTRALVMQESIKPAATDAVEFTI